MISMLRSWTPANVFLRLRWRREGLLSPLGFLLFGAFVVLLWAKWEASKSLKLAAPETAILASAGAEHLRYLGRVAHGITPADLRIFLVQLSMQGALLGILLGASVWGLFRLRRFMRGGIPAEWRVIPARPGEILVAEADYPVVIASAAIALQSLVAIVPQKMLFLTTGRFANVTMTMELRTFMLLAMPIAMSWIWTLYRIVFMRMLRHWHVEARASTLLLLAIPPLQLLGLATIATLANLGQAIPPWQTGVSIVGTCVLQLYLVLRAPLMLTADSFRE